MNPEQLAAYLDALSPITWAWTDAPIMQGHRTRYSKRSLRVPCPLCGKVHKIASRASVAFVHRPCDGVAVVVIEAPDIAKLDDLWNAAAALKGARYAS